MNKTETSKILTLASMVDNRALSPELVSVWQALLDDITYEEAATALKEHYRTSEKWLMPATLRNLVNAGRLEARRAPQRDRSALRSWLLDHGIDWVAYEAGDQYAVSAAQSLARDDDSAPFEITGKHPTAELAGEQVKR